MKIANELFPTGKFRKVDTDFRKDSTYEKELMATLILTGNDLHKSELEYHGKFGHTLGRIQHIALMSRIEICYTAFHLENQTLLLDLPGFQGIKSCIQHRDSHPHKPIFYPTNSYDGSNIIILTWSVYKV